MPSYHYGRPIPIIPPAGSLPFPGNIIRQCSDCGLRQNCTAPVPGDGSIPANVMLVGQNPGFNEDLWNKPFIGAAGQYLDSLLFQCSIPRESVYISNIVKCLTPNNRAIKPEEMKACSKWLDIELGAVQPRIIVAMGAPAIKRFLGDNAGTVEHLHGKPVEIDGRIILPAYHPAAALHNTTLIRQCQEDFQVLRGLLRGKDWREFHVVDEFPNPEYKVADTPAKLKQIADEINKAGLFAVDTEQCRGELWSVQISTKPGTAWFIPIKSGYKGKVDLTQYDATAIVHYYLHDINYLSIDDNRFFDSMTMAYLVGASQGLKELASRLCGVQMQSYSEVVKSGQQKLAIDYLHKASKRGWGDPPQTIETKWDNKEGCLMSKSKRPWHISRKIKKALDDYDKDDNTDLWGRWKGIPDEERAEVESKLGLMPESSLADIPFEQAVAYSARDADVTLRVYYKLKEKIEELGLDFVLNTDLRILPMVDAMMRNGMAVDVEYFRKLSDDYDACLRASAVELANMVGHPFNPNSSQQVAQVIYNELRYKPTKKTPSGDVSTDDAELKKTGDPVAKGIIKYRGLQKLKSTYADNMIRSAHPDGNGVYRVHTKLNTTRVETGRLSSSKTDDGEGGNFQNIPTRNKEAKAIKNGFITPDGRLLLEADYGQIEMCTLAHLSNCSRLIELFNRGGDPHTEMAARIFGVPLDEASKSKYRYPVKRLNFGIAYLIGAHGLANQIQEYIADLEMEGEPIDIEPWDEPTCEKFIGEWYSLNPEVKDFQLEMAAEARRYGYVQDIFGRIRYIPEVSCPIRSIAEAGVRQAANFPVTASATEIIKRAMGDLWQGLPKMGWQDRAKWLLQIHDSLLVELDADDEFIAEFVPWMRKIMCGVVKLVVPVKVDFKIGKKWGELQKFSGEDANG